MVPTNLLFSFSFTFSFACGEKALELFVRQMEGQVQHCYSRNGRMRFAKAVPGSEQIPTPPRSQLSAPWWEVMRMGRRVW